MYFVKGIQKELGERKCHWNSSYGKYVSRANLQQRQQIKPMHSWNTLTAVKTCFMRMSTKEIYRLCNMSWYLVSGSWVAKDWNEALQHIATICTKPSRMKYVAPINLPPTAKAIYIYYIDIHIHVYMRVQMALNWEAGQRSIVVRSNCIESLRMWGLVLN